MEKKKKYVAPNIKCLEFRVEHGFANSSLTQRSNQDLRGQGYAPETPPSTPSGGYFGGSIADWD